MRISRSVADQAVGLYSRELFAHAGAVGTVDTVDEQLRALVGAVRGHSELRWALTDPGIPAEKKRAVLEGLFGGAVDPTLLSVVEIMLEMQHLELLRELSRVYSELSEKERGIVSVEITTAVSLTDALRESIKAKLSADIGKPVTLRSGNYWKNSALSEFMFGPEHVASGGGLEA